ncbi:hypothetical protein BH24CHL5_BH24CHL5_09150 [soil metagenome]
MVGAAAGAGAAPEEVTKMEAGLIVAVLMGAIGAAAAAVIRDTPTEPIERPAGPDPDSR